MRLEQIEVFQGSRSHGLTRGWRSHAKSIALPCARRRPDLLRPDAGGYGGQIAFVDTSYAIENRDQIFRSGSVHVKSKRTEHWSELRKLTARRIRNRFVGCGCVQLAEAGSLKASLAASNIRSMASWLHFSTDTPDDLSAVFGAVWVPPASEADINNTRFLLVITSLPCIPGLPPLHEVTVQLNVKIVFALDPHEAI